MTSQDEEAGSLFRTAKARSLQLARATSRITRRHYGWVLSVAALVIAAVGLYVTLDSDDPWTPEQRELQAKVPPKVGWACHRQETELESGPEFGRLVRARLECQPVDPGPDELSFSLFSSEVDQKAYIDGLASEYSDANFDCDGPLFTRSRWVDRGGESRGELLCADGSSKSILVWSDTSSRIVGAGRVELERRTELHRWWQRAVKFEGDGMPRRSFTHLRSLLPDSFYACEPDDVVQPITIVAASCKAGDGISSVGAALLPDRESLDDLIDAYADTHPGATDKGCDDSTFSFTSYGPGEDGKPVQGKLLCYVSEGAQWFLWTAHEPLVFAYASREDEDWFSLYESWSRSLSHIGGL